MAASKRRRKTETEPKASNAVSPSDPGQTSGESATPPGPEALGDTSVAAINYEENDADAVAPMNPKIRLRHVAEFRLHLIVTSATGQREYQAIEGQHVHARMTERDIFDLNGPGTYRVSWYRTDRQANGSSNKALYGWREFTLRPPASEADKYPDFQPPGAVQVRPLPGRPQAIADNQRIVPDGFDSVHQWVFSQLDTARMDREELMLRLDKAMETIVTLSAKNGEMATQNASLAASIVSTLHESNKRDITSRLELAKENMDIRYALMQSQGGGGFEKMLAQYAGRIADRFIPAGNAKPDQITSTLDKVDKTLPKLGNVADRMPAIEARLARMDAFFTRAEPMFRKLEMMTGSAEAPADGATQPTADGSSAPSVPVTDAAMPDSVDV